MLIPEIIAFFSQIFSVVSTVFMIWMLIDCVRNQAIQNRGTWFCFILFTQLIGATVYFFARGPWMKIKLSLFPQWSSSSYQTPPAPQSMPAETFSAYDLGYQAHQQTPAPASQENTAAPEMSALHPEYEQLQVTYPEMPPMEQHR
ncbi:MAG: PLDc_N domain-containing protein [Ktedonobacteraceae bacterium]|nr:PLDc_N domain-containing protein [Ktedonobacteraceae bacterium]